MVWGVRFGGCLLLWFVCLAGLDLLGTGGLAYGLVLGFIMWMVCACGVCGVGDVVLWLVSFVLLV